MAKNGSKKQIPNSTKIKKIGLQNKQFKKNTKNDSQKTKPKKTKKF